MSEAERRITPADILAPAEYDQQLSLIHI